MSAAPPARIHGEIMSQIGDAGSFVLGGHRSPWTRSAQDLGQAADTLPVSQIELHFALTSAQAASLRQLLAAQQDRASRQYHKWLTPEEFGERFGLNDSDGKKVEAWLEQSGFSSIEMSRSRTAIRMNGTAKIVQAALGVPVHRYLLGGKEYYAATADPILPRSLRGVVSAVRGLNSYHPHSYLAGKIHSQLSVGIQGNHLLAPADLAVLYNLQTLYNAGTDGTGQSIAVVGQSQVKMSDIETFQSAAGLPVKDPAIVLAGDDPGFVPDDELEADLDLEWTGAVARGASILYVASQDALVSTEYAIDNRLAPVISISFGVCEAAASPADLSAYNSAFAQAAAEGITIVASSGDSGAAACDDVPDANGNPEMAANNGLAVNFPASSPFVTALGGTELADANGSFWNSGGTATSYIPEIAWNDTSVMKVLSGTGGGVSTQFTKPSWQQGTGVPADGARDVPDIALSASPVHDPYLICSEGSCSNGFAPPLDKLYFVGGTSCAAPVFAGIVALLNQSSGGAQGQLNPGLYALASFDSGVFHDVELGDNRVPCQAGSPNCSNGSLGFAAGPGYDLAPGLGSVDAAQLVEQWGSDFQVAVSPAVLNFPSGSSQSADIQVQRFANFAGSVSFTCTVSQSLANTACSVPSSVSGSGAATLTVSNTQTSRVTPGWRWRSGVPPSFTMVILVLGVGCCYWTLRRRSFGLAAVAMAGCLTLTSCGSEDLSSSISQASKEALSGNVTVTATSGILQHSITVPITILASN